jgi:hypothetical protein
VVVNVLQEQAPWFKDGQGGNQNVLIN